MKKLILVGILSLLILACLAGVAVAVPVQAMRLYGPPGQYLSDAQVWRHAAALLWYDGLLTAPRDPAGQPVAFEVQPGESAAQVAERLEAAGLVRDADAFRTYLIYSGLDLTLQSGRHDISPAMSAIEIARAMQDATPTDGVLVVLPGWRMEEIAAALPTSGLYATPDDFLRAAANPPRVLRWLPSDATAEGVLFPGTYSLPRGIPAEAIVETMMKNFSLYLSPEMEQGFAAQGLSVYEAVIVASIVQREAVLDEEKPMIASVYLNRIKADMRLGADPTVQYALGRPGLWWKSPLMLSDLQAPSPYNTYLNPGLPPAPIANPGLAALRAVAFPAETTYYFFRAACDGSGRHNFAETFDEHLQNGCP
ncbi:MAG: endolytic transglycosylase MltG [Anaerolineales bacterium]